MSEDNFEVEAVEENVPQESELDSVRRKADLMGVKYHHRANAETIKKAIEDHEKALAKQARKEAREVAPVPQDKKLYLTEEEYRNKELAEAKRNVGRLVRVRLQCLNPAKKEWPGEIISVGSARLGTFKKYVPYNLDEPYHIPYIIYQELLNRKCRIGFTVKGANGQQVNRYKLINEYAIEKLPPLSNQEIQELARRQAMAGGVE